MLKMTRRLGRLSGLIAAGVAIIGTGSGVMAASYSAFSATTDNQANAWSTGSVSLNNDAGSALFTNAGQPQQMNATSTQCIKVTSTGNLATTVRLYSTGFSDTHSLGQHIVLAVQVGTGGGNASCTGFSSTSTIYTGTLAGFNTTYAGSYASGLGTGWAPTGSAPESRTFQFTWSYDSSAPQSSTANDTFTWEAQGS